MVNSKKTSAPCLHCGKETTNRKFCSRDCMNLSRRNGEMIRCLTCNEEFYANKSKIKANKTLFCSDKCRLAKSRRNQVRLVCPQKGCGKEFYVSKSQAARRKYCSRACHSKNRTARKTKKCGNCNKRFSAPTYRKSTYCSKKCCDEGRRVYRDCVNCGKKVWPAKTKYPLCSKKCRTEWNLRDAKECLWCGTKFKSRRDAKCCSLTCSGMYQKYGQAHLSLMNIPQVLIYPNEDSEGIWLPISASEIEITMYLHSKRLDIEDIMKHIKRWRAVRKNHKDFRNVEGVKI